VNRHTLTLTRLLLSLKWDTRKRIRDHYDVDRLSNVLYHASNLIENIAADELDTGHKLNAFLLERTSKIVRQGWQALDQASLTDGVQRAALEDARVRIAEGRVEPSDEELVLFGYRMSYIVDPALVVITDVRRVPEYEAHRFDGFGVSIAPRWVYNIIVEELEYTPGSKGRHLHTSAVPVPSELQRELFLRLKEDMSLEDAYNASRTLISI
jgi:hypothetical protein